MRDSRSRLLHDANGRDSEGTSRSQLAYLILASTPRHEVRALANRNDADHCELVMRIT
jgi:hypothetical protein